MTDIPRWDLSNVYPSLESAEFQAAVASVTRQTEELEQFFSENLKKADGATSPAELGALLGQSIDRFNALQELGYTIYSYIQSFVTTDSRDTLAMKKMSEFQRMMVRVQMLGTQFQAWVGKLSPALDSAIESNPTDRKSVV